MNRFYMFIIIACCCSCQKELHFETVAVPQVVTVNSSKNQPAPTYNYQPASEGSYWKYRITGEENFEHTVMSTGTTQQIDEIPFTEFSGIPFSTPITATGYLYGAKHGAYHFATRRISAETDIHFIYLYDSAAVGSKWEGISGVMPGYSLVSYGEIIERNITVTISGKAFNEVIHSRVVLWYVYPYSDAVTYATYDFYTANHIGAIKVVTTAGPVRGGQVTTSELLDYSIK